MTTQGNHHRFPLSSLPWEPWFAWHPVKMLDGRWAWWRTIMRREVAYLQPTSPTAGIITDETQYAEPFLVAIAAEEHKDVGSSLGAAWWWRK